MRLPRGMRLKAARNAGLKVEHYLRGGMRNVRAKAEAPVDWAAKPRLKRPSTYIIGGGAAATTGLGVASYKHYKNKYETEALAKSLVMTSDGPKMISALKAGKAALKAAPTHRSLRMMTSSDASYAASHRGITQELMPATKGRGNTETLKGLGLKRVGKLRNRHGRRITVAQASGLGESEGGFHIAVPTPGKGQRDAHHIIVTGNGQSGEAAEDTLRHEYTHTLGKKPLSRQYRLAHNKDKQWREEARADASMGDAGRQESGYLAGANGEPLAQISLTRAKVGWNKAHARKYKKVMRKIDSAKGNSPKMDVAGSIADTETMFSRIPKGVKKMPDKRNPINKGLFPYGYVKGIGRVKMNSMVDDFADVTDAKDVRRLIHRSRIIPLKSRKKPTYPGAAIGATGAGVSLPRRTPPKAKPPKPKPNPKQGVLFDVKGRVNPKAKPNG